MAGKQGNKPLCPIDFALAILGNKWTLAILRDLFTGTKRTSELLTSLRGISPRTLARRLRELEDCEIITRKVYPEIPPRVEYSLTPRGRETKEVMLKLSDLGEKWRRHFNPDSIIETDANCPHCANQPDVHRCAAFSDLTSTVN